ncbi:hypothetical protein, partial [Botryobacter ruber]|uniref:hypothetical protein n=1 Tax=Botryobacter ruber TaxID=2171629 RepID=UPI00196B3741
MKHGLYSNNGYNFYENGYQKFLIVNSNQIYETLDYARTQAITYIVISYAHGYNLKSIDFVKDYPFIQGLHIVKDVNGMNIDAVHALSNLEYLYINRAPEQTLDLDVFPKLITLNFEWDKHVKNLSSCTFLKELTI